MPVATTMKTTAVRCIVISSSTPPPLLCPATYEAWSCNNNNNLFFFTHYIGTITQKLILGKETLIWEFRESNGNNLEEIWSRLLVNKTNCLSEWKTHCQCKSILESCYLLLFFSDTGLIEPPDPHASAHQRASITHRERENAL